MQFGFYHIQLTGIFYKEALTQNKREILKALSERATLCYLVLGYCRGSCNSLTSVTQYFNYMQVNEEITINGWRNSGIAQMF